LEKSKNKFEQFFPMILQTVVGIVVLLIVWLVISRLPMLDEFNFPLDFTLASVVSACILTVVIALLISFSIRMELRMSYVFPQFTQLGTMVKYFIFLIVILIAYGAYKPLLSPYMGDLSWIYHLCFLLLFVAVIFILARSIYLNIDSISALFTGTKSNLVRCEKCGNSNRSDLKFCSSCGAEVPKTAALNCGSCGTALKPGSKFCPGCGVDTSALPREKVVSVAPTEASYKPTTSLPACVACGAILKEGAQFCSSCGAVRG
jgi:uncharacterized paraquat-inducible protein A